MFLDDISELSRGSYKEVIVVCDFRKSESCLGHVIRRYSNIQDNIDRNNGKYSCPSCSKIMLSGRNHPRCKYKNLDDHLMDVINSEAKAYLLGWIASDGWLRGNGQVAIEINTCDVNVLELLRNFVCPDLPFANGKQGAVKSLTICSRQWVKSIQMHLNLSFEKGESYKKIHLVQMPAFASSPAEEVDISDYLKWCFLRGYFEGDGSISIAKSSTGWDSLRVNIASSSLAMRMMIVTFCRKFDINICMNSNNVQLSGKYAARFLEKIYAGDGKFVLQRKYDTYKRLKTELSRFWDRAKIAEEAYLTAHMKDLVL